MHNFAVACLVLGGLLITGALLSGFAGRSFLSLAGLFVLAGFILGHGATGVLHTNPRSPFVNQLATVALIVILFRDGLEVDAELLQTQWRLPLRKLVIAMPVTAAIIALGAKALTSLSWTDCFLLGALLSPTDPVMSSGVVTNPKVPARVRHSLNLESGLNDGLALPAVIALSSAAGAGSSHFVLWKFVLQDVGVGLITGVVIGLIASVLLPRIRGDRLPVHQRSLYALGVAFAAYGVAVLPPKGNGLIAVYVAAITLGVRRSDLEEAFTHQSQDLVEIVKLGIFVVFGSLLTLHGLFTDGVVAVAIVVLTVVIARPAAVFAALAGTDLDVRTKAFISWFGPKGVATMTFSLLVLNDGIASGARIFNFAALVVFCSAIVHGATDNAGVRWLTRSS